MKKIDNYLQHLFTQEEFINEVDLKTLVSKTTPEKIKSILKGIKNIINKTTTPVQSLKKIKRLTKNISVPSVGDIDKILASKVKKYKLMKQKTKTVIKNSIPGISEKALDIASSSIVVFSMMSRTTNKITLEKNLKKNIQEFVMRVRRFVEEEEETKKSISKQDIADLAVAWIIVVMGIAVATGGFMILLEISSSIPYLLLLVIILTFIIAIVKFTREE